MPNKQKLIEKFVCSKNTLANRTTMNKKYILYFLNFCLILSVRHYVHLWNTKKTWNIFTRNRKFIIKSNNLRETNWRFLFAGKILKRTQLRWTHRRGFDPQIAQFRRRLQQIHRFYVRRVLRSRSSHRKTSTNQTKNSPPINRKYTNTAQ